MKDSSLAIVPIGLPNLGNTCFFNSALQLLYQIQAVRNCLDNLKEEESSFINNLKALFQAMKTKKESSRKLESILNALLSSLVKDLENYSLGEQSDAFEAFLTLLNKLLDRDKKLNEDFYVTIVQACLCPIQPLKISFIVYQNQQTRCSSCGDLFSREFQKVPQYLIVNYGKKGPVKKRIAINKLNYSLQSKCIYKGDGIRGHYYAECLYDKTIYVFNDSLVKQLEQYEKESSCLFAIYRKTNEPQDQNRLQQDLDKILSDWLKAQQNPHPHKDLFQLIKNSSPSKVYDYFTNQRIFQPKQWLRKPIRKNIQFFKKNDSQLLKDKGIKQSQSEKNKAQQKDQCKNNLNVRPECASQKYSQSSNIQQACQIPQKIEQVHHIDQSQPKIVFQNNNKKTCNISNDNSCLEVMNIQTDQKLFNKCCWLFS